MQIGNLYWVTRTNLIYPEYHMKPNKYYVDPCDLKIRWWTRLKNGKFEYHLDGINEQWIPFTTNLSKVFILEQKNARNQHPID